MAESRITKTFIVSIRNEKIDVEIDYEATIYTEHFVRLEYKNWIIDIYAQKTSKDNCNFIQTMAIYVIKGKWILFADKYNDYSIKETTEIDEYCYRVCFKKKQVDIF
jgi:hypothetical protein